MTSMQSDTESNVSGFIRYNNKDCKHLYLSIVQSMEIINQDIIQVQRNVQNIVQQAGPLESQLTALLHSLKPINLLMETD